MRATFRQSMQWLHTWAGVVLGSVLFAMFWMGTLSVFDREIDRWMMPATRIAPHEPARAPSLDAVMRDVQVALPFDVSQLGMTLPTPRAPAMRVGYVPAGGQTYVTRWADPHSGRLLPDQGTLAGTGFIFPFHFMLHLQWKRLGYWIVGLAAMAMLALLVSGVVIHRKIFASFFLFRPRKQLQRSALDLHNMTGVLGLPFHFTMALSGLVIFIGIYFPQAPALAYRGDADPAAAWQAESFGRFVRDPAGRPGASSSLDAMAAEATRRWQGGRPYFVRVWNPGDANAYVELRRSYADDVTMHLDTVYFDAGSGAVLTHFAPTPTMNVQRFISGIHFIQFDHWPLRWLYFALGLSGCVMIATGFVFWLEARRARHAKRGLRGVRVVHGLTVGSVTGIVLATLAFFIANRLLPADAAAGAYPRATLEMWAFYGTWIATFAHAWLRPARAWREQAWAIAALAVTAVALNALTTGDHLLRAIERGLWAVAGMDLALLAGAAIAATAAIRIARPNPIRRARAAPQAPVIIDSAGAS